MERQSLGPAPRRLVRPHPARQRPEADRDPEQRPGQHPRPVRQNQGEGDAGQDEAPASTVLQQVFPTKERAPQDREGEQAKTRTGGMGEEQQVGEADQGGADGDPEPE